MALTKSAIENYKEYEQLVGGVETLFGAGGQSLEEYAESVGKTVEEAQADYNNLISAQNEVLANAENAYKTSGLSMNEYMETVTSFSASLIQSLGGDTQAAAEYADKAIVDMSDNANKMGTDISSIQTAYQGFAKQNYTMLDNLKLGYGGTKTEMERLILDAEKLDTSFKASRDSNGDLTMSFSDIVDAIHIVQDDLGITGTTAKEASTTIEGSVNSMKSAWSNLVTGLARDDADIGQLVDNLVTSIVGKGGEGGGRRVICALHIACGPRLDHGVRNALGLLFVGRIHENALIRDFQRVLSKLPNTVQNAVRTGEMAVAWRFTASGADVHGADGDICIYLARNNHEISEACGGVEQPCDGLQALP